MLSTIGAPTEIRTQISFKILPFEESDFANLSMGACLVQPRGIEPRSTVLQTAAMTTSAKVAYWGEGRDSNSQPTESQSVALPLSYRHHIIKMKCFSIRIF